MCFLVYELFPSTRSDSQTYTYLKNFLGGQEPLTDTTLQQPADSIATIRIILNDDPFKTPTD